MTELQQHCYAALLYCVERNSMVHLLIILILGVILYCLGSGLFYLVREKNTKDAERLVRALTWRVGLSVGLFFLLFLCFSAGLITPHGVGQ